MRPVSVARTLDRSVLGTMVDFAKAVPAYLPIGRWDADMLGDVEGRLGETPCRASGRSDAVIFPDRAAPELLANRWVGA